MPPEAADAMRRRTASLHASAHSARTEDGPLLTRCAWCERIALGEAWLEPAQFEKQEIARLGYRLTHGICPDCLAGSKRTGPSATSTAEPRPADT